jgi:hypothetical protein
VVVVALVGGELDLELHAGLAVDEDPVAATLGPVRRVLVAQAGDVLDHDAFLAASMPRISKRMPGDGAGFDGARGDLDVLVGVEDLVALLDAVELDVECRGHHGDHRPPRQAVEPGDSSSDCEVSGFPNPMISNMVNGLSHVA